MMTTITRTRGDTLVPEEITVTDSSGAPKDIAGATFLLTVSTEREPVIANNLFQIVGVITDEPGGVVEFPLTDNDADNVGDFYFDIQMTSGGKDSTVMNGSFVMTQDITK